jgi:sec-independent protein translocase protein TatA
MGLDNPLHIAFLLVVLLLVFGARRLPEMGRSLGSGLREFKDGLRLDAGAAAAAESDAERPASSAASPKLRG